MLGVTIPALNRHTVNAPQPFRGDRRMKAIGWLLGLAAVAACMAALDAYAPSWWPWAYVVLGLGAVWLVDSWRRRPIT